MEREFHPNIVTDTRYQVLQFLTSRSSVSNKVGGGAGTDASGVEPATSSEGCGAGSSCGTFVSSEGEGTSSSLYVSISLSGYS